MAGLITENFCTRCSTAVLAAVLGSRVKRRAPARYVIGLIIRGARTEGRCGGPPPYRAAAARLSGHTIRPRGSPPPEEAPPSPSDLEVSSDGEQ
jgi:hypothetical protein